MPKTKQVEHVSVSITFRLPDSVVQRLDAYRDGERPYPSRTKVIWRAVEQFLEAVGQ